MLVKTSANYVVDSTLETFWSDSDAVPNNVNIVLPAYLTH